jgi:N-sulfoglucosamine sulfohydrolase
LIFQTLFLLISGWFVMGDPAHNIEPERTKPNILFMIADDWSFPHAGILGDPVVRTPTFDWLAQHGALMMNAFCASPSCSPSRASILTGRYPHQNGSAGNLWSVLDVDLPNWVSELRDQGYHTGSQGKGWGPGNHFVGGYMVNPAGQEYDDFNSFIEDRPDNAPFCFWYGSYDPHRSYEPNTGVVAGMDPGDVHVPGFLPDLPCVRNDILDYYFEVERFDRRCGQIISQLNILDELNQTLIIVTSDNGMPFPRAKANLYDAGTRMPLAIYWKAKIEANTIISDFVNFVDLAPTILEACGLTVPETMAGKSFLPGLLGYSDGQQRDRVFLERERHANVRKGDLSYPMRGVRTAEYLYIRNIEPQRFPAGDPTTHQAVGQYGDVDNSITKFLIMGMQTKQTNPDYFSLAFEKRPAEELYNIIEDQYQLHNLVDNEYFSDTLDSLRKSLDDFMEKENDPRASNPHTNYWDTAWYVPDYKYFDFDLKKGIAEYRMLVPTGYSNFDSLQCD